MGDNDRRTAPAGLFRLTGYDQYDYSDYFIADYPTLEQAAQEARHRASTPNGSPPSFSDLFLVYDDRGICKYRVTHEDLGKGNSTQELEVPKNAKRYKFFQFFGMADGKMTGRILLNGALMHEMEGEPTQIATAAAQEALKYGKNSIRVEIQKMSAPGSPTLDFAILAVDGNEEDPFDSDRIVELQEDLADASTPWTKDYGFTLEGDSFSSLKKK